MLLLWVIALALIIWLVLYVIGKMLPLSQTIERSAFIDAPPSMLWSIIVGHHKEKDWRNNLIEVVKQDSENGMAVWKELRRNKETFVLQTTVSDASHFIFERKIIRNKKYGGMYRYEIAAEEQGSRLKVKHVSDIYSPLQRIKRLLVPSTKSVYVDQYISDVKQRALHVREERDGYLG